MHSMMNFLITADIFRRKNRKIMPTEIVCLFSKNSFRNLYRCLMSFLSSIIAG